MYRDILTNKWVLGGIGFLIVLSVACVLWYQHDTADERKAAADAKKLLRQSEITKKATDTDGETEQAADVAPAESETPTAEKPVNKNTAEVGNNTEAETQQQSETPSETETVSEARVSPYGFGPYPEVPEGFSRPVKFPSISPDHELMTRVEIKLYKQGVDVKGATMMNGLVFPIIKGQVYVKWDSYEGPSGVVRYISRMSGFPVDTKRIREIRAGKEKHKSFTEADIPSDIKLVSFDDGGIDPYTFLDLPK